MKILHYTFTSLRLACSFSLLIAYIFHYFYTSRANVRNNRALVAKN